MSDGVRYVLLGSAPLLALQCDANNCCASTLALSSNVFIDERLILGIHIPPGTPLATYISIMSQADIDAFVRSARYGTLTPHDVTTAVARGIPVNGRNSGWTNTALHHSVLFKRRDLVVALLATGADANLTNNCGKTPIFEGAAYSTADILQLLIDAGGGVNEPRNDGCTPLIALIRYNVDGAAARLEVLLACPDLNLDATYYGKTAEEWAVDRGYSQLAVAIAEERRRRIRWSALRAAWITATVPSTVGPLIRFTSGCCFCVDDG